VKIGDPPGHEGKWEKRFRALLEGSGGARSLTLMEAMDPLERDLDGYFFYAFRYAAGCALQRAAMLQTRCRLLAVADDSGVDTDAGSNRVVADWHDHDRPFDLISFPHQRAKRGKRGKAGQAFRPVVFLWDAGSEGKDAKGALDRLCKAAGKGLARIERTHRDGRRGVCLIADSTKAALKAALAAAEAARERKLAARVVCDFGPVLGSDLEPDKKLFARLQAADDLPGLPLDCVLATEAYAAQAKFDLGNKVRLVPVGRAEIVPTEEGERQTIRSRPSLPIYTAEWARGDRSEALTGPSLAKI
jgi:hypothetical protein